MLTTPQISLLRQWVEEGMPEGEPADLPATPNWAKGWQLGEPDLVVRMTEPYRLASEGTDVYRNFVIPTPVSSTEFVKAVEIRPLNRRAVHHAVLFLDRTSASRQLDEMDDATGFGGMTVSHAQIPAGHFIGWTPGKLALAGDNEMAWKIDAYTDLVLQLHMPTTGKTEDVQTEIGLYFARGSPTKQPLVLLLRSRDIDIPPGDSDYVVEDSYRLPVAVDVLGIYPHAHYIAKQMRVFATLPGGEKRWLMRINDWNFNWQDDYRYDQPIPLPQGTVLTMSYTYDNSPANVRNPSNPPRRVVFGPSSTDEMAELVLQVLPKSDEDLDVLWRHFSEWMHAKEIAYWQRITRADPNDHTGFDHLADYYLQLHRPADAVEAYRESLRLAPGQVGALSGLGTALSELGQFATALDSFQKALDRDPNSGQANLNVGEAIFRLGRRDEALRHHQLALTLLPNSSDAHYKTAVVLASTNRWKESTRLFLRAIELDQKSFFARYAFGVALAAQQRHDEAITQLQQALELNADWAEAHNKLGASLGSTGRIDEAIEHFRRALELRSDFPEARKNLGIAERLKTGGSPTRSEAPRNQGR
jgi:tetratricopeptide (TPR) repeat protein